MKLSFFVYLGICIFDFGGWRLAASAFFVPSFTVGRGDSARRFGGDFAACGRRVSFPAMGKKPMAQATFSWPCGPIHLEDRRGTAQDER